MTTEVEEIKKIVGDYMKELKGVTEVRIIFAKRINNHWKVVIKYATSDNPDMTSMLIIDWETKKVDTFREEILPY